MGAAALCLLAGCATRKGRVATDIVAADAPRARAEIIIPDKPLPVETYAADELRYHIRKATGVTLEVRPESKRSPNGAHIYLGACEKTKQSGIDGAGLEANARIIRTIGSDLFIAGRDSDGRVLHPFHTNRTRCGTLFGVYDFLEKELGVRWLWPGELGEHIPRTTTLTIGGWNETVLPKLQHSRLRAVDKRSHWPNGKARHNYYVRLLPQWLRRQRFSEAISLEYGHAFGKYWQRFGKTNPEFFALKPNGKREPSGAPVLVQMCVSNPDFHDQVIDDWLVRRKKWNADRMGPRMVNGCENDKRAVDPSCTCDACRAWDPANARTLTGDNVDLIDSEKKSKTVRARHSLSDRYARYYLALQEKARKHDPDARVFSLAYADYFLPPTETTLNKNILTGITFGGGAFFPRNKAKLDESVKVWDGWKRTGASLFFRPNFTLAGGNFPIYYAGELGKLFSHCYKNGMIATDFDSLTGQWAVQGPTLYVLARIHEHPDWSTKRILAEYYSGFGPAKRAVRAYFQYWKSISRAVTPERLKACTAGIDAHGWREVFMFAGGIFTPEVMQEGERLLARAGKSAAGDPIAEKRVRFLEQGLKNAELTLETQRAYVDYKKGGSVMAFAAALNKLDSFRDALINEVVVDWGYNYWCEVAWSRGLIKMLGKEGKDLTDAWRFMWDPENKGATENWQAEAFDDSGWFSIGVKDCWERQPVGKRWAEAHNGVPYNGFAWYRNAFTVKQAAPGKRYALGFGAVDEACVIWLNGKKIHTRPYPYKGDRESWQMPFEVDITAHVRLDRPNSLAIRVEDNSGAGGIWKGVRVITSDALAQGAPLPSD